MAVGGAIAAWRRRPCLPAASTHCLCSRRHLPPCCVTHAPTPPPPPRSHHICLEVGDIAASMAHVSAAGVRLLSDAPRPGAHGLPVVFAHPKDMCGVLTELEEVKGGGGGGSG